MVGIDNRRGGRCVLASTINIRGDVGTSCHRLSVSALDGDGIDQGIELASGLVVWIIPVDHA